MMSESNPDLAAQIAELKAQVALLPDTQFEERLLKRLTWAILAIVLLAGVILFEGERLASGIKVHAIVTQGFSLPDYP
jgi:hypothetical protein